MKKRLSYSLLLTCIVLVEAMVAAAQPIAFPGAEGFGKYTTGGRGGKVLVVTTLEDDGAGSLRKAVQAKGPRIVVFAVSGTIHLQSKLDIKGNITIAGQTAPGDGICLADYPVVLSGDNIIVRYLRFRMGDKNQKGGMVDGSGSDDAFGGTRRNNIIVDHCSVSWSTDEALSVYSGDSTTLQWNLISEPLNYSYHFEKGDKDYEHHGYGGIWGGRHLSAHHNLFAHCNSRNPRFNGLRNTSEENVDFRNNVIYNWGGNNVYAGEGGNYNIVNNYYKYGPNTNKKVMYQVVNPWSKPPIPYGKYFVDGNYVDGSYEVSSNNWQGVRLGDKNTDDPALAKATAPFAIVAVTTQSAKDAYESVLIQVGCSLPNRDTLDERIINDVKHRKGRFIDVQGGYPHGTEYEATVNAWPVLRSVPAAPDKDHDGMPDAWESAHALNPADAGDAILFTLDKEYTNVEVYVNGLVEAKK
ncbi:pectate lyase [Niastella caeni]|uniref:Pectate lyase n=1 Tax=Niastella caeni TaxID=2569763 RepID=A0A4S8HG49_9BACT|nr:pectate lyase [Niastella caeni]THU34128.1 pectate lyase [Niastella caeni]